MAPRQNFLDGTLAGALAQLLGIGERPFDLLLSAIRLPNHSRDRPAVARHDNCFAALDLVEQPGKVGFGLGGPNFTCRGLSIGLFD